MHDLGNNYKVSLDIFEGPLDLLLNLIKKDEVDVQDVSIERVTQQYLDYMQTFSMLNIDLAGEFIVMAANLMYIKSRTLLPKHHQPPEEDVEEEDPRWELILAVSPDKEGLSSRIWPHHLPRALRNTGQVMGPNTTTTNRTTGATVSANRSVFEIAQLLGSTSAKITTRMVMPRVA